jgi:UDP-N-acetyl-D-galactosamine dehydrogenase
MGKYVVEQAIKLMVSSGIPVKGARVGIFGLTFKEDCADLRNSRVTDIIHELESYSISPLVHDPLADAGEAENFYGIALWPLEAMTDLDALIIAVGHKAYKNMPLDKLLIRLKPNGCIIDIKSILDVSALKKTGTIFWRL